MLERFDDGTVTDLMAKGVFIMGFMQLLIFKLCEKNC